MSTVPAPASVVPTLDCWATTKTRTVIIKTMKDKTVSNALIALSWEGKIRRQRCRHRSHCGLTTSCILLATSRRSL